MKSKNIYLIRGSGVLMAIIAIFIAVVLNAEVFNVIQLQRMYLLVGIFACAFGYSEIADHLKLGFGITRFSIFRNFTIVVLFVDGLMFLISIMFIALTKMADPTISILYFFDYRLIIYFSLVIYFLGQFGMLLGNVRMPEYLKPISLLVIIIILATFITVKNKSLINSLLIIFSIGLSIINYLLIKNIKIEIKL
jgi:hypothetical protein